MDRWWKDYKDGQIDKKTSWDAKMKGGSKKERKNKFLLMRRVKCLLSVY